MNKILTKKKIQIYNFMGVPLHPRCQSRPCVGDTRHSLDRGKPAEVDNLQEMLALGKCENILRILPR